MRLAKATKATLPVGGTSLKLANIMGPQNKTHFCKKEDIGQFWQHASCFI